MLHLKTLCLLQDSNWIVYLSFTKCIWLVCGSWLYFWFRCFDSLDLNKFTDEVCTTKKQWLQEAVLFSCHLIYHITTLSHMELETLLLQTIKMHWNLNSISMLQYITCFKALYVSWNGFYQFGVCDRKNWTL